MPSESPTRIMSTPASSTNRAEGKSYAVTQVTRFLSTDGSERSEEEFGAGRCLRLRMSGTVILPLPATDVTLILTSGAAPFWPKTQARSGMQPNLDMLTDSAVRGQADRCFGALPPNRNAAAC